VVMTDVRRTVLRTASAFQSNCRQMTLSTQVALTASCLSDRRRRQMKTALQVLTVVFSYRSQAGFISATFFPMWHFDDVIITSLECSDT